MSSASSGTDPSASSEDHRLLRQYDPVESHEASAELCLPNEQQKRSWNYNRISCKELQTEIKGKYEEEQKQKQKLEQQKTDIFAALDDNVLRYSYKGTPPEIYSAKKEFNYTQPLVEKQVNIH